MDSINLRSVRQWSMNTVRTRDRRPKMAEGKFLTVEWMLLAHNCEAPTKPSRCTSVKTTVFCINQSDLPSSRSGLNQRCLPI